MHTIIVFLAGVAFGQIPTVVAYIKAKVTPVISKDVAAAEAKAAAIVAQAEKKV